jgi:murein DD-endopeptidase MepM/ murein hydrolase activator NlpD
MAKKIKTTLNDSLKSKFRFVVLNDATFEEKFSMVLSRKNVWIFVSTLVFLLVLITSSAIIYTPLKYMIPGFGDFNFRSDIIALTIQADSIEKSLNARQLKTDAMLKILNDSSLVDLKDQDVKSSKIASNNEGLIDASTEEITLRNEVSNMESFAISYNKKGGADAKSILNENKFFKPVNGVVTDEYDMATNHYGIDIAAKKDEAVFATLDGIVVSTGYELETGHTIYIQHKNNLISIYKHNSKLFKSVGAQVKAGDNIATVGNTGSNSTGPHLHFEIWYQGSPINPREFILF